VRLAQLLFTQGFGTRRECAGLIAAELVVIEGVVCSEPDREVEPLGLNFSVRGEPWTYHERAFLVMNKPAGYECSQKPKHHPSVYSLLPAPLRRRGVQAIGRLDEDTTGVLLFTDEGALIHRLTSPKHHVPKVYEVGCKHPVDAPQVERLRQGVLLHEDNETVRAAACETTGPCTLRLTLTEGKYHQVKRMIAAAGNRVESLGRSDFGGVRIDALAPGAWRWLSDEEAAAVTQKRTATTAA
jgi:16S rRNA pseudouridine516 synthase